MLDKERTEKILGMEFATISLNECSQIALSSRDIAVTRLAQQVTRPVAFVDDLLSNLDSVAEHAPRIARFQSVADPRLRAMAPARLDYHTRIDDWSALSTAIEAHIS